MTEELMELLTSLQQAYGISQEDFDAVVNAIEVTVQEAVGIPMDGGEEELPPEAMIPEEG